MGLHPCNKCGKLIDETGAVCPDCRGGGLDMKKFLPFFIAFDLIVTAVVVYVYVLRK